MGSSPGGVLEFDLDGDVPPEPRMAYMSTPPPGSSSSKSETVLIIIILNYLLVSFLFFFLIQTVYLSASMVDGELIVVADSSGSDRVEIRSGDNLYNDSQIHTVVIDKRARK